MYGRTATARPAVRATDTATVNLRRRMALAVARRFGGVGQPVARPPAPTPMAVAPAAVAAYVDSADADADSGLLALDQRVRETGEW